MCVHGQCIVDGFGQVWTSQNRCEALFFLNCELHAGQIWPTPKTCMQFLTVPRLKRYDPLKWLKQRFVMLHLGEGVNWCEVQLFLSTPPKAIIRCKALN